MAQLETDRLVRKEVALGVIREAPQPESHIGTSLIAPFKDVQSDDVIFDYTLGLVTGLAPARAEDAESELAQKDDTVGTGRAAILDWALKDHYDPSDVSRFREAFLLGQTSGVENFPLTVRSMVDGFQQRVARDTLVRRRKLDNRIEWLILKALFNGSITYDDGKVKFSVDYGRPAGQTGASVTANWDQTSADPINDALNIKDYMRDTYAVTMDRAITSAKVIRHILTSEKFAARSGLAGGTGALPIDPRYLIDGWGVEAAKAVFQRATGITLIEYDSVYRTRTLGTTVMVNKRFTDEDTILYLPSAGDIAEIDDTVGFAATLTSPHPEGNWQSGFYEWERETVDPWGRDIGTGIKAFPVFPHLELTYSQVVL